MIIIIMNNWFHLCQQAKLAKLAVRSQSLMIIVINMNCVDRPSILFATRSP